MMPKPHESHLTADILIKLGKQDDRMLTRLQSFAFPILMWFFDPNDSIGTGRSYLMAFVCIELAKRGHTVYLNDYSIWPTRGERLEVKRYFVRLVHDILDKHYNGHLFEYRVNDTSLTYRGRKPR